MYNNGYKVLIILFIKLFKWYTSDACVSLIDVWFQASSWSNPEFTNRLIVI